MRGGQTSHDRRNQIQVSLVGHRIERRELLGYQAGDPRGGDQLELQSARRDARHFLEPATGLSGNSDKAHLIRP